MTDPAAATLERVRQLQRFALERLPALQLADGVFCHEVSAEQGGRPTGRSLRYTLMVLIGLQRAEEHGIEHPFHTGALRAKLLSELGADELTAGDFGLALWAESRADGGATGQLLAGLERRMQTAGGLERLMTMEASWVLIGLLESSARSELGPAERLLREVRRQLVEERFTKAGLLTHVGRGPRRRLPHFADQIYGLMALSLLARATDDAAARDATAALAGRLVNLQLPNGGWPWAFDALRGTVVEPYEVYSVHQDAMAVMGMHGASQATGSAEFIEAAVRGIAWNYGQNELGAQMFDPGTGMIYRSIRRKRRSRRAAQVRNVAASYLRAKPTTAGPEALEVNRTMRPYHLGWLLETWSGREELASRAG